jgi:zinc transport system substrate-binding protein
MHWKKIISCLLCGVLLCGCTPKTQTANKQTGTLQLVTTLFCYYDFARAVLQDTDTISIQLLLSPGMDSHSFEPAPSDILAIQNADIFIYNGGDMESWVTKVLDADEQAHPDRVLRCMMNFAPLLEEVEVEGGEAEHDHDHDDGESDVEYDEHIWTSPVIAEDLLSVVCDAICEADPANTETYRRNADAYAAEIESVNQSFQTLFSQQDDPILLFGDKFPMQYFANTYGLHCYAAFSGCSSDTEPSVATISNLIDLMKENHLSKVYYFEVSSPAVANVIAEETGATATVLQSCHAITQEDFDNGETYVSLMQRNLEALQEK